MDRKEIVGLMDEVEEDGMRWVDLVEKGVDRRGCSVFVMILLMMEDDSRW